MRLRLLFTLALALFLAPIARAGGPTILVGAVEDSAMQPDLVASQAKMELARLAGLNAVRLELIWTPGQTAPADNVLLGLQNAATAAQVAGIRPIVAVRND